MSSTPKRRLKREFARKFAKLARKHPAQAARLIQATLGAERAAELANEEVKDAAQLVRKQSTTE